ncbi:hypothetical protein BY458DRAFT_440641 [Sporodiniella umbellata]|nr:hypothetical protein BY458DRAFT_440641 [Sporodiniella umbellata]
MSAVDNRVLQFLKDGRSGKLVYGKETDVGYLKDFCDELGLPRSYGDPLTGRIDCSIIHEGSLWGCEVNALNRVLKGFIQIFPVNLMVHLLPLLLFKPSRLAKNPFESMSHVLASTVRSSTFLGSYIGIIWYCVCLVRTRIGHQVLGVNQTRLDNTLGPLLGSMLCGLSLLIENKHRRGEIILYVLPRALHSTTGRIYNPLGNQRWWKSFGSKLAEDVLFAASTMVVIHNIYRDEKTIRPSIRRAMTWILKDELAYEKEAQKKVSDNQIKKLEEEEQGLEIRKRRSLTP